MNSTIQKLNRTRWTQVDLKPVNLCMTDIIRLNLDLNQGKLNWADLCLLTGHSTVPENITCTKKFTLWNVL